MMRADRTGFNDYRREYRVAAKFSRKGRVCDARRIKRTFARMRRTTTPVSCRVSQFQPIWQKTTASVN
jgi:hypothetical protein